MLKKLFFLLLMISWTLAAFGQNRLPRLGVLPFAGGTGRDGAAIADLFLDESDIQKAFTIVPRTSAVDALVAEQKFQMSGYTDSDTIAGIGKMLNADFVVSGHIRRLGNRNLIITTIINVKTFEQLAGDYREYGAIEEVRSMMPAIANRMITGMRRNTSGLPKLAVVPFTTDDRSVNAQDGETLAQILAVEVTNTGRFAVLPRTTTMQAAFKELEFQMSGNTAEEGATSLGSADNPEYVLSARLSSLGSINMFTGQILNVEDGSLLASGTRDYRTISDGITLMAELALLLTDKAGAQTQIAARNRELSARERAQSRAAFFADPARLWSAGVSAGSSFIDPWVIGTIRGTIAPLRYSFLEIGFDLGFISSVEGAASYYSMYPFLHYALFMPFRKAGNAGTGGWYAGAGAGFMMAEYTVKELSLSRKIFAADVTAGVNLFNFLDISYTLRTNFASLSHKASVGYCYRFK